MRGSTAISSRKGKQHSCILLYHFKPSISRQQPPGLILGRPSFHLFPLAEGWVRAGSLGCCPPPAWHNGVTSVLPKSPPGTGSGDEPEWRGNASAWDCCWPHTQHDRLYPKLPQTGSDLFPAWVTPLLPAPCAPSPLPRALNPLEGL